MAANNTCIGVKTSGDVCGKRCRDDNVRCAIHIRAIDTNGPNSQQLKELGYIQRKEIKDLESLYDRLIQEEANFTQRRNLAEDLRNEVQLLRARHNRDMTLLMRRHQEEIARTGVDPDAPARARAEERWRARQEQWRARREDWNNRMVAGDAANQDNAAVANNNPGQQAPRIGELGQFARDGQNVHTTAAVKQTKEMVSHILKISVPTEFKWNARTCSKTPGDIITHCNLSSKGAWQMVAKYCQDEDVYEMGKGIYGRVLDGVWQYIVNSPDKTDLCRILRQEMEDNIGMCAQGNLTRLCNILAGYMEGIGVQESPAEILGRKLPLLMEIEDQQARLKQAFDLLVETGVPAEQWLSWIEPLVDEGTVQISVSPQGQVLGLYVS